VFLEAGHDDDKQLPVVRTADVVWVDRKNSWQALVKAVGSSAFEAGDHFGWWHATTEPPGRWPRSSATTTRSRANRLRRKPTGWRDGQRSANIFRARQMSSAVDAAA
jgi:hypothetical protein